MAMAKLSVHRILMPTAPKIKNVEKLIFGTRNVVHNLFSVHILCALWQGKVFSLFVTIRLRQFATTYSILCLVLVFHIRAVTYVYVNVEKNHYI